MNYLSICLNPTLQKTLRFSSIVSDTVNRTNIHRLDASGKGINVSRVLTQLGKNVVHLTQLGGPMRPLFLSLCEQDSLSVEWVESGSPIRFCHTLINDADSSVTELIEESEPVAAGTEQRLLEHFDSLLAGSLLAGGDYIIISGTKAAGFSDTVFPVMVQKAKKRGLGVILDIRGKDLIDSLGYEPDIIKPNLHEFVSTFLPDLLKEDQAANENIVKERIKATALDICGAYHCRIILTRGSGHIWVAEENNFFEVKVEPVKPLNTTGSGDAFAAGLASALGDGVCFSAAITQGIRCGALNAGCLRPGVIRE